jgi:uncharacterized protein
MRTLDTLETATANDVALLRNVAKVVRRFLPTAKVVLYGSVARGIQDSESDYDVLILTEEALSAVEQRPILDALYDIDLEQSVEISVLFRSTDQWNDRVMRVTPFYREVERDAVLL